MSINVWTGEGRICEHPEIRVNSNNTKVLYFTLAMDEGTRDNPKVNYQDCVAYGTTAEIIGKYCGKGDQLFVVGRSDNYSVIDRGERRKRQLMVIEKFKFGAKKKKENEERNEVKREEKNDNFNDFMDTEFQELKFY